MTSLTKFPLSKIICSTLLIVIFCYKKLIFSYGVYCERRNNVKTCRDYKYRLCCAREPKQPPYGPWTEWSECEGECGVDNASRNRTRLCYQNRGSCKMINGTLVVEDKIPCTIPCKGNAISHRWPNSSIDSKSQFYATAESYKWLEWAPWSSCSATCGSGTKQRSRLCLEGFEGEPCPETREISIKGCKAAKCHGKL